MSVKNINFITELNEYKEILRKYNSNLDEETLNSICFDIIEKKNLNLIEDLMTILKINKNIIDIIIPQIKLNLISQEELNYNDEDKTIIVNGVTFQLKMDTKLINKTQNLNELYDLLSIVLKKGKKETVSKTTKKEVKVTKVELNNEADIDLTNYMQQKIKQYSIVSEKKELEDKEIEADSNKLLPNKMLYMNLDDI